MKCVHNKWIHDTTINLEMVYIVILHCEHCGKVKKERLIK